MHKIVHYDLDRHTVELIALHTALDVIIKKKGCHNPDSKVKVL